MMTKHTLGAAPWTLEAPLITDPSDGWIIQDADGTDIATGIPTVLLARLIAEAPAMYGLLAAAIDVLDANGIVYGDCDHEPLDVLRAAREVIARIDGQEG